MKKTMVLALMLGACATDDVDVSTTTNALEGDAPVLSFRDKRGRERSVQLMSSEVQRHESERSAAMAKDRQNNLAIYRDLFDVVRGTHFERDLALPDPRALATADVSRIRQLIGTIVRNERAIRNELFPSERILAASAMDVNFEIDSTPCIGGFQADEGNGAESDVSTLDLGDNCALSKTGALYNDPRTYRKHLSCVRDQANRGTCGAFSIASVLESAHSKAFGTKVNLSEQMIYFHSVGPAGLPSTGIAQGMYTGDTLDKMWQKQDWYKAPYENTWNYNPSWSRTVANGMWQGSCIGYGETCSDTSRQGKIVSVRGAGSTMKAPPIDQGIALVDRAWDIWDDDDEELSILLLKAALFTGNQVSVGLMVTEAIKAAAEGDGYVDYHGQNQSDFGGHAVHFVSYIDNDELAIIAPTAPPGEHGGYFIVRNSWGPCSGDGGYLYIPYRWMKVDPFVNRANRINKDGISPVL